MAPDSPIYPLYDTAFTLHRTSPLYTGLDHPLERVDLQQLARKFRDILAGEVLRGVQVGLDPDYTVLGTSGALRSVVWGPLPYEERWDEHNEVQVDNEEDTGSGLDESRGHSISIKYEKTEYTAILFRDTTGNGNVWDTTLGAGEVKDGFESFPLLLCKMPGPLRDTFVEFLATTFDARVSILQFPNNYIMKSFEQYVGYVCLGEDGEPLSDAESSRTLKRVVGGVDVQIGFDVPGGSLKSITMKLTQQDLPRIIAMGKKLQNTPGNAPFFDAMVGYVNKHLALDLTHDRVKNTRIACNAFVLGAEGRVKFIYPGPEEGSSPQKRASKRLLHGLIAFAKGPSDNDEEP